MPSSGRVVFSRMDEVVFGKPAAEAVSELVSRHGAQRVFLMASGTLDRETDEVEKLRRALGNKCVGTFASMPAHSPRSAVIAAAEQAREARTDLIVTLGGGSITDGAKAVQLCLANDIHTPEEMDRIRGQSDVKPPTVRQISIPTTLSAGEFSAIAGVTNEETKVKEMFRHPLTIPQAVILDPEVTRHTPMWLLLSTGIRAVDHCVEGVCSNESTEYSNASSLHGLSLLARGLPRVKADPSDMAARLDCQTGSWLSMAGIAAGVPMGASHGIGYVLGAVFDVPHGHTSCIMLPSVMRWNRPANADRQALISAAMGHPGEDAGDVLDQFIRGLDMPRSLSDVKIGREHFDRIAKQAMGTPWVPRNPRPIPTPAEVKEILELAA
ncbi:iron-containing alcohol dehydrogenase [Reyranella massiliensis]|uniref:iron-containing alcohol dehydrogenase n=1 Tax=Reyranella massiliensis TaxID=445220 RepID=UPI0002EC964F|nr:iron-containing alcohol dehydrogenase [Reyranella massiliensis]